MSSGLRNSQTGSIPLAASSQPTHRRHRGRTRTRLRRQQHDDDCAQIAAVRIDRSAGVRLALPELEFDRADHVLRTPPPCRCASAGWKSPARAPHPAPPRRTRPVGLEVDHARVRRPSRRQPTSYATLHDAFDAAARSQPLADRTRSARRQARPGGRFCADAQPPTVSSATPRHSRDPLHAGFPSV